MFEDCLSELFCYSGSKTCVHLCGCDQKHEENRRRIDE